MAAGTVNGIIEAFSLQCGGSTGGMDYIIKDNSDCIDIIDKMLTLEGLQLIYEKNKPENA